MLRFAQKARQKLRLREAFAPNHSTFSAKEMHFQARQPNILDYMRSHTHRRFIRSHGASRIALAFVLMLTFTLLAGAISGQNPNGLDRGAVLNHLNAVINWYRDATNRVQTPGQPSDVVYQDTAQNLATSALRFAFDSARAEAALIDAPGKGGSAEASQANSGASQQTNYGKMQTQLAAQIASLQSQIEVLNKQIADSASSKREALITQRDTLQGQLELNKAMQDSIEKMANFVESSESANQGLAGTVSALARSVPEVLESAKGQAAKKTVAAPTKTPNSTGLVGQALELYDELTAMHGLDQLMAQTSRVRDAADAVRKPLRDNLVATIRQGNALAGSNGAAAPQSPASIQEEYQNLTNSFKQYSAALVPLAQEMAVLDESRSNFAEWRQSIARESRGTLQSLVTRVVGIAIALGLVLFLSELWRRLTFKYIRDQRRRRQFLVLRRVVIGFLFGLVIILGFVSEFSSLATFAGFVTAGIAVGLQTVLLSVAAYFFVIGRYGIRVGDRISIAGVTGDVIDIGLVRLYLMELSGPAVDLYPTGRVVVFSNSVLFQATTPLFKQIPGTDYTWHEVVLDLTAGGNHKTVQDKIAEAVNSIFSKYQKEIERQTSSIEGRVEFQLESPSPGAKLQFGDTGLELIVRYPVGLRNASEVDDHITRALLEMIDKDPELKAAITGSPKIRAVVKG
jgi:small-conductance mechanosensitive channel